MRIGVKSGVLAKVRDLGGKRKGDNWLVLYVKPKNRHDTLINKVY